MISKTYWFVQSKTRGTFFPKNIVFQLNKDFIDEKHVETFLEEEVEDRSNYSATHPTRLISFKITIPYF